MDSITILLEKFKQAKDKNKPKQMTDEELYKQIDKAIEIARRLEIGVDQKQKAKN